MQIYLNYTWKIQNMCDIEEYHNINIKYFFFFGWDRVLGSSGWLWTQQYYWVWPGSSGPPGSTSQVPGLQTCTCQDRFKQNSVQCYLQRNEASLQQGLSIQASVIVSLWNLFSPFIFVVLETDPGSRVCYQKLYHWASSPALGNWTAWTSQRWSSNEARSNDPYSA